MEGAHGWAHEPGAGKPHPGNTTFRTRRLTPDSKIVGDTIADAVTPRCSTLARM